jgi:hypothetical protein
LDCSCYQVSEAKLGEAVNHLLDSGSTIRGFRIEGWGSPRGRYGGIESGQVPVPVTGRGIGTRAPACLATGRRA